MRPAAWKLAEDVWELVTSVYMKKPVPRVLLKAGKRDRQYFEAQKEKNKSQKSPTVPSIVSDMSNTRLSDVSLLPTKPSDCSTSSPCVRAPTPWLTLPDTVAQSTVAADLSKLKQDLRALQARIRKLEESKSCTTPSTIESCHLYVQPYNLSWSSINNASLEQVVRCPVLWFTRIKQYPQLVLKVKVPKYGLHAALQSNLMGPHRVRLWHPRTSNIRTASSSHLTTDQPPVSNRLNVVTWNCRGFGNSIPYFSYLFSSGSDVIVLQEHWLWPFELGKLQSAFEGIHCRGVSDSRLNEQSDQTRGCGGVAILWKKGLSVLTLPCPNNGRVCGIKISSSVASNITVVGVYMPSDGHTDEYQSCLSDLEEVLNTLPRSQPVVIAGDFNAHLGRLGDPKCNDTPNAQGRALKDLIDRNNLFVASLGEDTGGPVYTYCSGDTRRTIDYILVNQSASYLVSTTSIHDDHPLNTSDHLALSAVLEVSVDHSRNGNHANQRPRVNWEVASTSPYLKEYSAEVEKLVFPLIGSSYDSITQIEWEIQLVTQGITKIAVQHLPLRKPRGKPKRQFNDPGLRALCRESKQTWHQWKEAGRPTSGDLFERKKRMKRAVRQRINILEAIRVRRGIQKRDDMFRNHHPRRFAKPRPSGPCMKLRVEGHIITEKEELLQAWEKHFHTLGKSKITDHSDIEDVQSNWLKWSDNLSAMKTSYLIFQFKLRRLREPSITYLMIKLRVLMVS